MDGKTFMTTSVVVIGGGIAGLSSAALLARDGYQVTLLEKHTNKSIEMNSNRYM
jgi:2-polyprenyl-6-methoxyphenol hydroxylase-like FAD-dependent oxidoreductase